jgi:two-component system, NtrC family, response regulator HydG
MPRPSLKLLVVDDEEAMREVLQRRLSDSGFDVRLAADGEEAVRLAGEFEPDVVLSDVVLPDLSGIDLLRTFAPRDGGPPVVLITAHATVTLAVEAMKNGAHDFLTKPLDFDKLTSILQGLAPRDGAPTKRQDRAAARGGFGSMFGESDAMRAVYSLVREVAPIDASVLITGESGTGKELVARTLHELSSRADKPFVAINSAAIPRELMESEIFGHEKGAFTGATGVRQGCFELAHEGTLFLDEIAEMPVELQPKLLRVLEDGCVRRLGGKKEFRFDTRVVAATNRDPAASIADGALRRDLYYRLNVFSIELPPLRDRGDDMALLLEHFIAEFEAQHGVWVRGVSDEAAELLRGYDWPGNVRELRNASERAVVLAAGGAIEPRHLPPDVRHPRPADGDAVTLTPGTRIADAERELILRTLEETGNNKAEAARRLGVDVKTVRNKLKSYELDGK